MNIAVVGAGLSGLTCAFRLRQSGHQVMVYEREPHVGGRMASITAGGFTIDIGANFLLENYRHTQALAAELGIGNQWQALHAGGSGGVLRAGRLTSFMPSGPLSVLSYQGLSLPSRVRVLLYLLSAHRWVRRLDFFDLSTGTDARERVDADTYFRARLGDEVADWLIDPFVRTFHFHGARRISTKYFDGLAALLVGQGGFASHGFRRNMGTLSHALASRLTVSRDTRVTAVFGATDAGRARVTVGAREEAYDAVVLATPATVARELLRNPTALQKELLGAVEYSSTLMCAFRAPLHAMPDFEGIWVPYGESKLICCCANETRKGAADANECLLNIGLHEEGAAGLLGRSDEDIQQLVADEWCRLFPHYKGHMKGLHVQRWRDALPVYAPGLIPLVAAFSGKGQGERAVWLCGDYLNHPWVEGSIRCGEKVAARIGVAS